MLFSAVEKGRDKEGGRRWAEGDMKFEIRKVLIGRGDVLAKSGRK